MTRADVPRVGKPCVVAAPPSTRLYAGVRIASRQSEAVHCDFNPTVATEVTRLDVMLGKGEVNLRLSMTQSEVQIVSEQSAFHEKVCAPNTYFATVLDAPKRYNNEADFAIRTV